MQVNLPFMDEKTDISDPKKEMGDRIATLMEAHRLNQSDVARALDTTRATVSQWVNGTSAPSAPNLVWLAELLHTDVPYLVFGPEEGKTRPPGSPPGSTSGSGVFRAPFRRRRT